MYGWMEGEGGRKRKDREKGRKVDRISTTLCHIDCQEDA
jgi:hypothetical protein